MSRNDPQTYEGIMDDGHTSNHRYTSNMQTFFDFLGLHDSMDTAGTPAAGTPTTLAVSGPLLPAAGTTAAGNTTAGVAHSGPLLAAADGVDAAGTARLEVTVNTLRRKRYTNSGALLDVVKVSKSCSSRKNFRKEL